MNIDWLTRRWSSAWTAGAALAFGGIGALFIAQTMLSDTQAQAEAAARERQNVQSKLSQTTREKSEISSKIDEYRRLLHRGLIGPEKRLDWVDALLIVQEENKLSDLQYSIDPQKPFDYPGVTQSAGVETLSSPMKLELNMLHEGDLFRVLAGLRQRLPPYMAVNDCAIERQADGRLKASCKADLITIREAP